MVLGFSRGEQGPLDVQQLGRFPREQVRRGEPLDGPALRRRGEPLDGPALRRRQAIALGPSTPAMLHWRDRLRALEKRYDSALEELRELRDALAQLVAVLGEAADPVRSVLSRSDSTALAMLPMQDWSARFEALEQRYGVVLEESRELRSALTQLVAVLSEDAETPSPVTQVVPDACLVAES